MATIQGSTKQDKISIKQFKGIFESPDGDTQIKLGIATEMRNFAISDSYHLATRPGIAVNMFRTGGHTVLCIWSGYYQKKIINVIVWDDRIDAALTDPETLEETDLWQEVATTGDHVHMFDFGGNIYMLTGTEYYKLVIDLESDPQTLTRQAVQGYVPLVVTGAVPGGGGTSLERANLLTNRRRIQFSADGSSTVFVLPEKIAGLVKVVVDNVEQSGWTVGTGDNQNKATAPSAPPQGINNVEILYEADVETELSDRALITSQKYAELFNGSTDGRVFLYGDGTNITYYSGITEEGAPSAEYFPALNEIAVGAGNSPIVAMARHYTRLMAFKPDSTYSISYDTIWLADNTATAGFYLRPMHRELGADAPGQVVTTDNFLRTFCRGNIYEWKQTASYYQDERYARVVSGPVQNTIRKAADRHTIYFYDDDRRHRFFAFLNDDAGTVLVNDYQLDVWYKWTGFKGVHHMERTPSDVLYFSMSAAAGGLQTDGDMICTLRESLSYDYLIGADGTVRQQMIDCYWESGHMAFGSESTRKYSSYVWVTLLAGPGAVAVLKTRTDRKPNGPEKTDWANTTGLFDATEFDRFSFQTYLAPFARRLKLKLKKFVYYKLIIESEPRTDGLYNWDNISDMPSDDRGSGAVCVLNIDIKVRNAADAK